MTPSPRKQSRRPTKSTTTKKNNKYKKITVGARTSSSRTIHVLICGDGDVADVYHRVETKVPRTKTFLVFGETDRRYGGYSAGRMGEYFSAKPAKGGCGYKIKGRVDWEDGMNMVENKGLRVLHVKHEDLVGVPGYKFQRVRI